MTYKSAADLVPWKLVALLFISVFLIWIGWALFGIHWLLPRVGSPDKIQLLGQVGDLFGGINALFAAFAFVGVGIAAFYQYQTFKLLEAQHAMQEEQHAQQGFLPLFFRLLELCDQHTPPEILNASHVLKPFPEAVEDIAGRLRRLTTGAKAWSDSKSPWPPMAKATA